MVAEEQAFIHVLVSLAILLFAAKIFAEIFHKFNLPIVLGELTRWNNCKSVRIGWTTFA